jgi:hypothetical protein
MLPQRDLTLGGRDAILASNAVLFSSFPGIRPWLAELGARTLLDISDRYVDGGKDLDNYAAIIGAVVDATHEYGEVAYVVPGHPNLGVTATQRFLELAERDDDLIVEVVPGVSSLDTIAMDLGLDYLERSCVIVDSNRLLLLRYQLDPRVGVLIYHPSSVGTSRTDYSKPWQTNRLDLLQDYLCEQFEPARKYYAVVSQSMPGVAPRVLSGTLDGLADAIRQINYGTTLYVPPAVIRGVDRKFLDLLVPAGTYDSAG